jgi:hypothetical protein
LRADDGRGVVNDAAELVDLVIALVGGLDAALDELDCDADPAVAGRASWASGSSRNCGSGLAQRPSAGRYWRAPMLTALARVWSSLPVKR